MPTNTGTPPAGRGGVPPGPAASNSATGRTGEILAYILKIHKHASAYFLVKLAYLLDYFHCQEFRYPLTDLHYRRFSFGPFDERIFSILEALVAEDLVRSHVNYTASGREYVTYAFNDEHLSEDMEFKNAHMRNITIGEFLFIRNYLHELLNYTEKDYAGMVERILKRTGKLPIP
jgi:hypothetical protein